MKLRREISKLILSIDITVIEDSRMESNEQTSANVSLKETNKNEQESRSFLRDEFLNVLFALSNKQIKIQFEKTKGQLNAVYTGSDFTFSTISVKDLETKIGKEPFSLLRTNDVISIDHELE